MNLLAIGKFLWDAGRWFGGLFTGGNLDSILNTINKGMSDEVKREEIKAEVTREWIRAQAGLLVGRTWWFQVFFVVPLGLWWSAVILDSILPGQWNIAALPSPLDEWATWIISALFLVDGTKAVIGRAVKK